ncbi:MAG: LysR substrate-binding domain-containing protein [Lachnospiraceae bacterium]
MRDFFLLIIVAAEFIFGYFIVRKWGCFLEKNNQVKKLKNKSTKNSLRIGFSNPQIAEEISEVLDKYSRKYPDVSISLFSGTSEELVRELSVQKLDMIFLSGDVDNFSDLEYHKRKVLLNRDLITERKNGLVIEPISKSDILQNVLWLENKKCPLVKSFIKYL